MYDKNIEIRPAGDQGDQSEPFDGNRTRLNCPDFVQHTSPILIYFSYSQKLFEFISGLSDSCDAESAAYLTALMLNQRYL